MKRIDELHAEESMLFARHFELPCVCSYPTLTQLLHLMLVHNVQLGETMDLN